ncbi:MAG: 16S rRNA (cytosine(1402)-N(4))-methyltransferase, partial [bacterium]|nr:16S rRNA (cytosine(1402)-N(4))-methyltransferase [bacterium]
MRTRRSKSSSELVPPSSRRSSRERSRTQDRAASANATASQRHLPVLLHEAIEYLAIQQDDIVVDATLGGAGHATAIAEKLSERGTLIGFDLDADAIARAKDSLATARPKVHLIEGNFRDVGKKLDECGIPKISKVLFDLGWSSF